MIGWQAIFDLWSAPKWCLKGRLFFYGKEKLFFEGLKKCSDLNGFFSSYIAYISSTKSTTFTTTATTFESTSFPKN